ncbi:MAG: ribonuclease P protein component [Planctomycetota bacterium]
MSPARPRRAVYRRRHRLTHANEFRAVYDARLTSPRGPIVVFVRPNGMPHPRLGLSVGKRVGNAVRRNAIKRRLRDAFRHVAAGWPEDTSAGLDVVIAARSGRVETPDVYAEHLEASLKKLRRVIADRAVR